MIHMSDHSYIEYEPLLRYGPLAFRTGDPIAATRARRRPIQSRSKATVDAILEATTRVLRDEGYDKASTNRIAKVAGVSIGSLYQYFPNKNSLFLALLEQHAERQAATVARMLAGMHAAPPEQLIRQTVEALLAAHRVDPELHRVLMEQLPHIEAVREIRKIEKTLAVLVRSELEKRRSELRDLPDLELVTFILIHTVEGLTHSVVMERPDLLDDRLVDEITTLILRYLLPRDRLPE
ncbi:MAG: TetR/AcrR family transcriptional regulator [Proteobacteria bacterium]|nr:TetR/AcrR family transcriptional regulator [Pseudomonadota bacterium]MCP4921455.1 TetR/AcrR family transcriptional regulator [Pseudomonadota bacterium]